MKKYNIDFKFSNNKKICITYQVKERINIKNCIAIIKDSLTIILKIIIAFK